MENNENKVVEESGISLSDLIFLAKKNVLLILIVTMIFTIAGAVYGLRFKQISYTSTATAIVSVSAEPGNTNNYQNILAAQYMINSFKDYIDSIPVAAEVVDSDDCKEYDLSIKQVLDHLTVSTESTNSLVLTLKYVSNNEEESIVVLNQILASTKRLADEGTAKELLGNKFFILSDASKDSTTASRGAALVIIVCFLIGAMLSFGVVLIQYLLDDTYNSKEAIEKHYNINVIASLPDISDSEAGGSK